MGYLVVAGTGAEALSDEAWMDLIALASKHGFSAPRLALLEPREQVELTEEEATVLYAALESALTADVLLEHSTAENDVLDRDTVHRVCTALRQPGFKILLRTPSWR